MGRGCFFVKKSVENGGCFVKSGPFLNAGCIMYSISIFLFYILLIWGVRTHPMHDPPAYGPAGSEFHKSVFSNRRTLTAWHCPHSSAAVAERRPCSSRSISPALHQRVGCCGSVLKQTDGRTDGLRTALKILIFFLRLSARRDDRSETETRFKTFCVLLLGLGFWSRAEV